MVSHHLAGLDAELWCHATVRAEPGAAELGGGAGAEPGDGGAEDD